MEQHTSLGRLVDGLAFTQEPRPDEEVLSAIVMLKVRDEEGEVGLRSLWTDDLGWLERVGMHTVAAQAELPADDTWVDDEPEFAPLRSIETGPDALGDAATEPAVNSPAETAGASGLDQHQG